MKESCSRLEHHSSFKVILQMKFLIKISFTLLLSLKLITLVFSYANIFMKRSKSQLTTWSNSSRKSGLKKQTPITRVNRYKKMKGKRSEKQQETASIKRSLSRPKSLLWCYFTTPKIPIHPLVYGRPFSHLYKVTMRLMKIG